MEKSYNNHYILGDIQENYGLLLVSITGLDNISMYTFPNIENEIDKFIALLDNTDRMIITKRYGFDDGIPKTYEYLSQNLTFNNGKYSKDRIIILCNEAINNLKELIFLNSKSSIITQESFIYDEERITKETKGSLNFSIACDEVKNIPNYISKRTLFYQELYDKLINKKITNPTHKSYKK